MKRLKVDKMIITKNNYELYAIDYLEGTLDVSTQKAMDQFLTQYPTIQTELEEMQDFVLIADETIVFENKAALKKTKSIGVAWWKVWSITAGLLLVITLGLLYTQMSTKAYKEQIVKQGNGVEITNNSIEKAPKKGVSKLTTPKITIEKNRVPEVETVTPTKTPVTVKTTTAKTEKENKTFNVTATVDSEQETTAIKTQKQQQIIQPTPTEKSKKVATKKTLQEPKKKIYNMPMATLDSRMIEIQMSTESTNIPTISQAVVVGLALNQDSQNTITRDKEKSIKTPFGKINLGEIKEALIPETYIASK